MLAAGDSIADFTLPDQYGTAQTLSELVKSGPVVLFFYPAAMTPGCTAESCNFRDRAEDFSSVGASRVGISADDVAKQLAFSDKHSFDYPLLSDGDGTVASAFGVKRKLGFLPNKRATFVIAPDLTIIASLSNELKMKAHAEEALAALKEWDAQQKLAASEQESARAALPAEVHTAE
jgi:peroxiredoxin Q/BCP